MRVQRMCADACGFMTALVYSEAAVSSSQLSCQLNAILRVLQTAPLSLSETRPSEISAILRLGVEGASGNTWRAFFTVSD